MGAKNDAQYPYNHGEDFLGENVQVGNVETKPNGRREWITPPNLV